MALDRPNCNKAVDSGTSGEQPPNEVAFRTLVRTYGLLGRAMQPFFVRFGITGSQFAVLRTLRCAESEAIRNGAIPTDANGKCHGLRQTELGDRLLVRPPSVTGVIDRLERQGLFRPEEVARRIGEHQSGVRDHRKPLWTLLMFQLWCDHWRPT